MGGRLPFLSLEGFPVKTSSDRLQATLYMLCGVAAFLAGLGYAVAVVEGSIPPP